MRAPSPSRSARFSVSFQAPAPSRQRPPAPRSTLRATPPARPPVLRRSTAGGCRPAVWRCPVPPPGRSAPRGPSAAAWRGTSASRTPARRTPTTPRTASRPVENPALASRRNGRSPAGYRRDGGGWASGWAGGGEGSWAPN